MHPNEDTDWNDYFPRIPISTVWSRQMSASVREINSASSEYGRLLDVATKLDQAKYLTRDYPMANSQCILGAYFQETLVGLLLLLRQDIGADRGLPPILRAGRVLEEAFVEAFGVLPECRRRGFGHELQTAAMTICTGWDCYQIRSRSPVLSTENYQLKIKMGYSICPSEENDSYYFTELV
jgi:GNAT superfamily N-acetyltransferase